MSEFVAAPTYEGPREGYFFSMGLQGLGYYLDTPIEARVPKPEPPNPKARGISKKATAKSLREAAKCGDLVQLQLLLSSVTCKVLLTVDPKKMSCLHHAVAHPEAVQLIVEAGGPELLELPDARGSSALMLACASGHVKTANCLLGASACVDHCNGRGLSCLSAAATWGQTEVVQLLLNAAAALDSTDKTNCTALVYAAKRSQVDVVQLLLSAGASLAPSPKAADPVHAAVTSVPAGGDTSEVEAVIQLLLCAGANANRCVNKNRALHTASASGHCLVVKQLLDAGSKLCAAATAVGETVLHAAASQGDSAMLELLLNCPHGADLLSICDKREESALHRACYSPERDQSDDECVQLLIEHSGAMLPELLQLQDSHGSTCLHYVAQASRIESSKRLLAKAAEVGCSELAQIADHSKTAPLHLAARHGHWEMCTLLADAGASLEQRGEAGCTPLL